MTAHKNSAPLLPISLCTFRNGNGNGTFFELKQKAREQEIKQFHSVQKRFCHQSLLP
jgi:hypothetical protein